MIGKMFNAMFFIFAACSAGHAIAEADASCDSQEDATSQLQLHSGNLKSENKDSMSPWCFSKSCSKIRKLCLKKGQCCERAKFCKVATNPCKEKDPGFPGTSCFFPNGTTASPFEQSGINVTEGFQGLFDSEGREPITTTFEEQGMCTVNVHWHAGAEHYSVGEYDIPPPVQAPYGAVTGNGPTYEPTDLPANDGEYAGLQIPASEGVASLLQAPARLGFRCHHYSDNINNPAFTTEYNWKHCVDVHVGETYEVHWPASAAGACGTAWQYQTPFPDGLFCRDGIIDGNIIWEQIGVAGQVYTIINDDSDQYYFPDLIKGPIKTGDHWKDVAYYTGSSTGTTYNNTYCSQYAPITWQVDRKCHLVSASAFDKMCKDMMKQKDDMTEDLHPHGSRERVFTELAADNLQLVEDSVDEPRAF